MGCRHSTSATRPQIFPYHKPPTPEKDVFLNSNFAAIKVLWTVQHYHPYSNFASQITRSISSFLPQEQVPIKVFPKKVVYFDIATDGWRLFCSLNQKICVDSDSASVLLQDYEIFVCGGKDSIGHAYVLKKDGKVRSLPDMFSHRGCPGVVQYKPTREIYVFGGHGIIWSDRLRSSEKFVFSTNQWEQLPDMFYGRCEFNPCIHASVVYLCGGFSEFLETYNIKTNSFSILSDVTVVSSGNTAVIESEQLIVVTQNQVFRWEFQTCLHYKTEGVFEGRWSKCSPVVSGENVFIVDYLGLCWRFDLAIGEKTKLTCQFYNPSSREWEGGVVDSRHFKSQLTN